MKEISRHIDADSKTEVVLFKYNGEHYLAYMFWRGTGGSAFFYKADHQGFKSSLSAGTVEALWTVEAERYLFDLY